jgi:hypothetical protein
MKTFAELEQQNMVWVRAEKRRRVFELRSIDADHPEQAGDVLATIIWHGQFSASVEATGNRWEFGRKGFWRPRYVIQSVGTGEEPAQLTRRIRRAALVYPDGREFHWKQYNSMSGIRWVWSTADDEPLMGIRLRGVFQQRGEISLDPELAAAKAPSLLLFLGWYLILLQQAESSSAAIVVAGGA